MLEKIRVTPIAAESFGVRSMCTYVETPSLKVLLDAGVSLGPNRFGFAPHPEEYRALIECREKIERVAVKASVVTISHYHFDHHTPSYTDWFCNWSSPEAARRIYENKIVLIKNYRENVNFSQRRRGWMFTKTGGRHAAKLEIADGRTFRFGETSLKFSEPVFHGSRNSPLGWLLMVIIQHKDEKVLFASDVQGPMDDGTLKIILDEKPQLLIIGGPPVYLAGLVRKKQIELGLRYLEKIVEVVPLTILEHHLLRDMDWRQHAKSVFDKAARSGNMVVTAAEFLEQEEKLLEAQRKQLFEVSPPSVKFERWMKLPISKRKLVKPPLEDEKR